jgi:hypothetical protein
MIEELKRDARRTSWGVKEVLEVYQSMSRWLSNVASSHSDS